MPRLGVSVSHGFQDRKAPPPDKYGRRVRYVYGVATVDEKKPLLNPLYLKLAAGLTILATVSMAMALWRLFTFPH